jgi:hypothetical protein
MKKKTSARDSARQEAVRIRWRVGIQSIVEAELNLAACRALTSIPGLTEYAFLASARSAFLMAKTATERTS